MSAQEKEEYNSPFLRPAILKGCGLSADAADVLVVAKRAGSIDIKEICNLVPEKIRRNKNKSRQSALQIVRLLRTIGIQIKYQAVVGIKHDSQTKSSAEHIPLPQVRENATMLQLYEDRAQAMLDYVDMESPESALEQYFRDLKRWYPILGKEKTLELFREPTQENKDRIVVGNLFLVVSMAVKYQNRGVDLDDLIQEGNLGLMTAVDRFDVNTGNAFSTYATWWIRQGIIRYIENNRSVVRIPVNQQTSYSKLRKVVEELEKQNGYPPLLEEVAAHTGISLAKLKKKKLYLHTQQSLTDVLFIGKGGGIITIEDTLEDDIVTPADATEVVEDMHDATSVYVEMLNFLKNSVSKRDCDIFCARYGIGSDPLGSPMTLEQVGNKFSLTRERVRQIIARVWKKMKQEGLKVPEEKGMKDFLEYLMVQRERITFTEQEGSGFSIRTIIDQSQLEVLNAFK